MDDFILLYISFKNRNIQSTMSHSVRLGERILETLLKTSIITLMVLLTESILNCCSGNTNDVNGKSKPENLDVLKITLVSINSTCLVSIPE